MEMSKATWTTDSDVFNLSMTISKVDESKRLVFGWATLDNPDLQDDVVTFEASKRAFSKFRGNIREMHQKIAAGRMVEYRPQKFVDPETNEIHNGIFVAAYVSEGAESTWKKVLDGTLQAFSINGPVNKARSEFDPKLGKVLRYIDDYDINELSLVDAGGNPKTNLVSFTKDATGAVVASGELTDVEVHNVFLCKSDNIVEMSENETLVCQNGHDMKNIGWVEGNTSHTMEKVNSLVKEYIGLISKTVEGGVEVMAEEVKTEEVAVEPVAEEAKAVTVEEAAPVEEAGSEEVVSEEVVEEAKAEPADELEKALSAAIEELRAENGERYEDVMKSVETKFDEFKDDFAKRFAALEEQQTALSKSLESVVGDLGIVSKSVTGLNDASATRKSGDLGGEPEGDVLSKSNDAKPGIWSGAIL
jgi:Putative phage serine protease XkdF